MRRMMTRPDNAEEFLKDDAFRADALAKVHDWDHNFSRWVNWRRGVGPCVRAIWHTFTDEKKSGSPQTLTSENERG